MKEEETAAFYGWSWLMMHYLRFAPERKGQLSEYLRAYAQGIAPDMAAKESFGDLIKLQDDLNRYKNARRLSYSAVSGLKIPTATIDIVALDSVESALMPLTMRFQNGARNLLDVQSFAIDARKAAQRFPGQPRALELVAEGELDAEQFDAATEANDALLALRPTDARALLRRARIASAVMVKSGYSGGWKAIRSLIVKANRADPNDPFPLAEYYRSYGQENTEPTTIAFDGLYRALELAPQVADLRFSLAQWFVSKGKKVQARAILAPLYNDPHDAEVRAAARALVDPVATGDAVTEPKH